MSVKLALCVAANIYHVHASTKNPHRISSAMISRLMLNLRDPKLSASYRSSRSNHHHHQHYRSASQTTSGIFTTDAVLSTVVDVVDTSFCDQEGRAGAGRSTAPPGCQAVDTGQADVEGATNFGGAQCEIARALIGHGK